MSRGSFLDQALYSYLLGATHKPEPLLGRLRDETAQATGAWAGMQISRDQGQFMQWLVRLMGARKYLEVGTFTGYSALVVAQAMPVDGLVVACDINREWTAIGQRYWHEAGVAHKVDLRLAPAFDTMDELIGSSAAASFDMVFIDGDKSEYDGYYERALRLLRHGGAVLIDNALWGGRVADVAAKDRDTVSIRNLNEKVRDDPRVFNAMLAIGDGLCLALKR
jgi:predicted O-methyltransferase YrrM